MREKVCVIFASFEGISGCRSACDEGERTGVNGRRAESYWSAEVKFPKRPNESDHVLEIDCRVEGVRLCYCYSMPIGAFNR